eukprot:GEMP01043440.1.p1 GENE.GEMP01043440.1~~GEMP01043440.1.p1  ORF type:complete len:525 (+),score=101.45 GEMP01043440.1:214-1788(+)
MITIGLLLVGQLVGAPYIREHHNEQQRVAPDTAPIVTLAHHDDSAAESERAGGRNWIGFPRDSGDGAEWSDLVRTGGIINRACDEEKTLAQCGYRYPCRNNVCSECRHSRDCSEKYVCLLANDSPNGKPICVPRDLRTMYNWWDFLGTILITVTAMLCAVAGMGGGGVYVPLMLLLLGLSTKEAVPLSQVMILGGSLVNIFMFAGDRHPKFPNRPRIDYEVVMLLNPALACGVTLGVICHVIAPGWLIVSMLLLALALAFHNTLRKGVCAWKKETEAMRVAGTTDMLHDASYAEPEPVVCSAYMEWLHPLSAATVKHCALISLVWCGFLAFNLLQPTKCSSYYWIKVAAQVVFCIGFTVLGTYNLVRDTKNSADLEWSTRNLRLYPVLAMGSGFLGGFLGIGGGMVMGPLMLELGMVPEANQATTALFVFLTSSLASVQFWYLGVEMPQYVAWYTVWVIMATFIGQTGVGYILRIYQRSSIIILSIAAVVGVSMCMMTIVGSVEAYTDWKSGASMNFQPYKLCA